MSEEGIINHLPEISLRGERRRRCRHLRRRRRFFIIITIITEQGTTGTIFVVGEHAIARVILACIRMTPWSLWEGVATELRRACHWTAWKFAFWVNGL